MPAIPAISVGLGVLGLVQGNQAGKRADRAAGIQESAAKRQADIGQQQADLAKEKWKLYKDNIYPLEQKAQQMGLDYKTLAMKQYKDYYNPLGNKFAKDAMTGVKAQPERAARDARLQVDQQFNNEQGAVQRNLQRRGVQPGSGNYNSGVADTGLNRAASKAFTVNRAIEAERNRAENVNFNREATALGRTPNVTGGPPSISGGAGTAGLAYAGQTMGSVGRQFGNISGNYANAAGNAASGGIQLGMQAYDLYNKYKTPNIPGVNFNQNIGFNPTSFTPSGVSNGATSGVPDVGFSPTHFANGGPVQAPALGQPNPTGGQVNGAPGVDQVPAYIQGGDGSQQPAKLTNGEYVIPADVMQVIGTGTVEDIINKARIRKQQANQSTSLARRTA